MTVHVIIITPTGSKEVICDSLVRGRSPRHRGVHVGRVLSTSKGTLIIQIDDEKYGKFEPPLKRGDGIVVDRGVSKHINNEITCWRL